jgi:epoxide hydrolase 4
MEDDGTPEIPGAAHVSIPAGDVTLHGVRTGSGPLVLLLHGFPEFWWSFRYQLPALAAAGFTAVALDLRGYNLSDRPASVAAYRTSRLAADVAAVVRALGAPRASVVGHDWGGVVGWAFAARHPELLERLVVLNSPHPSALLRGLRRPDQVIRSAYMLLFQLPAVPERLLAARNWALLRSALRASRVRPVAAAELELYVDAARRADGLRGAVNYYRAMGRSLVVAPRGHGSGARGRRIEAPVLVVWGERDPFLGTHLARPPPGAVRSARVERLPEAGHCVQLDEPERVNALIVEFLRGGTPAE